MKSKTKLLLFFLAVVVILAPLPVLAQEKSGFSLVFCGINGQNPCTFNDLVILLVRLVNFLLACAAIVAAYHIVSSGFWIMASMGNPEKLTSSKEGLSRAVIGFGMVLISFAFINLLLGLMGVSLDTGCDFVKDPFCLVQKQGSLPTP